MHTVRIHLQRKCRVCSNQQHQPVRPAYSRETQCNTLAVRRTEVTINHAKPPRQASGNGFRLRRPRRVGQEQGRGQAACAPRRKCPRAGARSGDQLAPRPALGF